ncbi:hypothetical protein BA195_05805 [Tenacibaculum soleae]|uniref:MotA/TolQ/ExbB proton channel domain-containing protein n=1 Tax=Tenacibaculum soleae TaxID=447689 RepID=A0A1B9Y328_9FLAO|nr:MotA/TolQ/ExbB proton channel family protein [Tenacibaculum soleae]OCK44197.1 hypothetical protein BA195_05805 [Tenacibaculum soleae]
MNKKIGIFEFSDSFLVFVCQELPWYLLIAWLIYALLAVTIPNKIKKYTNYYLIESIPATFVTIGLLGTFLGIAYGLINFNTDPSAIKDSISGLLEGLKTAFYTSIFGIVFSLVFKIIINFKLNSGVITNPEDDKELDFYRCINNNLIDINKQTRNSYDVLHDIRENKLKNISDGTKGLQKKLDKFFKSMASQSADAIQEALMTVMVDFNETFKELISQLVSKNFENLTASIDQLIIWQKDYKGDITLIKDSYEKLAKNHEDFVKNTDNWVSKLDLIAGSSSQLQTIIDDFQAAFDDKSRFSEVISNISFSVENLKNTSIAVNEHTNQLQNTTEALNLTKNEITDWLHKETSVQSMVSALSESLIELKSFEVTQIEDLNQEFLNRLNNTFKGLDEIMKAQLQLLINKTK